MESIAFFQSGSGKTLFVLSPHLDDAVWSLGAILQKLVASGQNVQVITIFSETIETKARKVEDQAALKEIGCSLVHLDFADAILDGRPLEAVFDQNFTPAVEVVEPIVARLRQLIPEGAMVLAPAGFGGHVDHLTTRTAAVTLPAKVFYYEDLPYAARPQRRTNAETFLAARHLHRHRIAAPPELIAEQLRLYNLYTSQRQKHHVEQIGDHLKQHGFGFYAPGP